MKKSDDVKIDYSVQFGLSKEILEFRKQHDKTVDDLVRAGSRYVAIRIVVEADARFQRRLEEEGLWEAYQSIAAAVQIEAARLGAATMNLCHVRGGCPDPESGIALLEHFGEWYASCKQKKLTPQIVIDCLAGHSPYAQDKTRKFRNGTCMVALLDCLRLW